MAYDPTCIRTATCSLQLIHLQVCPVAADFEVESEEELSVVAGDEVAVIGKEDDGWIQVSRARDGKKGLVPVSYLSTS